MLLIGLFAIGIYLLAFGLGYAIFIYKWPWKRTYSEVALGVGATIAGEMLALALVLIHYGYFYELWWIISFPVIAFVLTGLPMMIAQEIKTRRQNGIAKNLDNKYKGD